METTKKTVKIMIPIATVEEAAKVFLESKHLTEMQKIARQCLFWEYEDEYETDEKEVDETNKN